MAALKGMRGVTLVELLVALAFVGLLAAQTVAWASAALRAVRGLDAVGGRNRSLWLGFDAIAADVRDSGFHAGGIRIQGLAAADRRSLLLLRDENGDGDTDDGNERIRYLFDAGGGVLRRATGRSGAQVFVDQLDGVDIEFVYRGLHGSVLALGAGGLDTSALAQVRGIDLIARADDGRALATTSVGLRNVP